MGLPARKGRSYSAQRPALRQALRDRILEAAQRIVTRDGYAALSMRKIADAIGYSPASLYLYFENRDEIARALGHEGHAQLLAQLEPLAQTTDPRERVRALAHAYVAFGYAHPQIYRAVFIDVPDAVQAGNGAGEGGDPGAQMVALFADALEALHSTNAMSGTSGTNGAARAEAFWATLHGIVTLSLTRPGFPRAPLEQLVDAALDAWLDARSGLKDGAGGHVTKKTKATTT